MGAWRWLDLGGVDGATMVNVFVALAAPVGAGRSPPTVLALHPRAPFANVGFHQEAEREIDLDYCRAHGIPVVRRVVGGGAILDGPWEEDYMVVVPAGAPGTDRSIPEFYERYLAPVQASLARLGVRAERSGLNDLASGGRKVSANGAMTLDGSWVLVGDLLLDVDPAVLSRVLRVPDEKFRGKLASGMGDWLTSVRAVTGQAPDRRTVVATLWEEFARGLGVELVPGELTAEEAERLERLKRERTRDDWTFQKDHAHPRLAGAPPEGRAVKIAHDAVLARVDRKAAKLVRVTLLYRAGRIEEVQFAGDFFTQPFDGQFDELERALAGQPLDGPTLTRAIGDWLGARSVRLLGASAGDLAEAVLAAAAVPPGSPS